MSAAAALLRPESAAAHTTITTPSQETPQSPLAPILRLSVNDALTCTFGVPYIINLTNITKERVAFKLKTNAPRRYTVKPWCGLLERGATVAIELCARRQSADVDAIQANDVFSINAMAGAEPDMGREDIIALWSETEKEHRPRAGVHRYWSVKIHCSVATPSLPTPLTEFAVGRHNQAYPQWRMLTRLEWQTPDISAQLVAVHQQKGGWPLLEAPLLNEPLCVLEGFAEVCDGQGIVDVGFASKLPLQVRFAAMTFDSQVPWMTTLPRLDCGWTVHTEQFAPDHFPCLFVKRQDVAAPDRVATNDVDSQHLAVKRQEAAAPDRVVTNDVDPHHLAELFVADLQLAHDELLAVQTKHAQQDVAFRQMAIDLQSAQATISQLTRDGQLQLAELERAQQEVARLTGSAAPISPVYVKHRC